MTTATVQIRRNKDGVIREIPNEKWDDYLWAEGNYSCDCNRHLSFERAIGNDPDFDEAPCGETLYAVRALKHGLVIYQDDRW